MISIVCVYNNEIVLTNSLLKSLEDQTVKFELIKIDNTGNKFKSAAEALNYGSKKAKGKYIMFVHQDIHLLAQDWLERAEFFLEQISDLGVAGLSGMRGIRGDEIVGFRFDEYGQCDYNNIKEPIQVQTLDEQMLIVTRNIFDNLKFDEKICDGWHLYGVDFCLSIEKFGFKSYVLPLPFLHSSKGLNSMNEDYYLVLKKILRKHKTCKIIYTTCGVWYTINIFNYLNLLRVAIETEIGKWIGRNNIGAAPYIRTIKLLMS